MTRFNRRAFVRSSIAVAVAGLAYSGLVSAQAYPTRPVTIIVPHPAGGAVDSVGRFFADRLKDELKESVIVENRAGASGMIGAAHVARSEPDGYTLYVNASIHSINPLLYKKSIKFDAVKDFTPVAMLTQGALIFSANTQMGVKTIPEFLAKVRAAPNKYSFATSGFGSAGHMGAAQFLYENDLTQIPIVLYKGASPALQDLVGGQVNAIMDPMLSSLPFVKAGKLTALAVTGAQRSPLLPEVPTLREAGMKDFELYSWYGLWAPANLPPAILKRLDEASAKIMQEPEMKAKLATFGFESAYKNSADFSKFMAQETARYKTVIEKANITVD